MNTGKRNLKTLVEAARDGDTDAFGHIVARFQDMAVAYAYAVLGDFHLAEDAAQEAFIETFRKLPNLREPAAFPGWFRRILVGCCSRISRGRKGVSQPLESVAHLPSDQISLPDALVAREARDAVWKALQSLTAAQRRATTLYYMHGHSTQEIAHFLEVPVTTVKKRLNDARSKLKERMLAMAEQMLHENAPSRDERFVHQVVRSALPLQVGWIAPDGSHDPCGMDEHTSGGTTIGRDAVEIPACRVWFVEPRQDLTGFAWDALFSELRTRGIPGLYLRGDGVTDTQLAAVGKLDHLQFLALMDCHAVTDEGLAHLGGLNQLQHFYFGGHGITDRGLAVVSQMPNLVSLRLDDARITDDGMSHLKSHRHLRLVSMRSVESGDGALRTLAGKPDLAHVILGNRTTDAGLAALRDFPALNTWDAGRPGFMAHVYSDPSVSSMLIDTRHGADITDVGMAQIAKLDGLAHLDVWSNAEQSPGLTGAGVAALGDMKNLRRIGVPGHMLTDESMQQLARLKTLETFASGDIVAGDAGFVALAHCTKLRDLRAWNCLNLTGSGVSALAALPGLVNLYLGGPHLDDDSLKSLPEFASLREFSTGNHNAFTDEAFAHIARIPNLERLTNMYCNATGDRATEHVAAALKLKQYGIWHTQITDRSLELLGAMPALEDVLLWCCPYVTDSGLAAVAKLPGLRKVDLQHCPGFTAQGMRVFQATVHVNFQPVV